MVIVKASLIKCVLVAIFSRTEIIIDAIVAVFSKPIQISSFQRLTAIADCSGLFRDRSGLCCHRSGIFRDCSGLVCARSGQLRESSILGRRRNNYFQLRDDNFRLEHGYLGFNDD